MWDHILAFPQHKLTIAIYPIIGVEHVGGDMFISVPKGDAIFMKVCIPIHYYVKQH